MGEAERAAARTQDAERLREIAEMALSGMTQHAIAIKLGVSDARVSQLMSRVRANWKAEATESYESAAARELASIARDEAKLRREIEEIEHPSLDKDDKLLESPTASRQSKLQIFDRIAKLREQRGKILGLDAPTKVAHAGQVEHIHEHVDLTKLFMQDPAAAELGIKLVARLDKMMLPPEPRANLGAIDVEWRAQAAAQDAEEDAIQPTSETGS